MEYSLLEKMSLREVHSYINDLEDRLGISTMSDKDKLLHKKLLKGGLVALNSEDLAYIKTIMASKGDIKVNTLLRLKNKLVALLCGLKVDKAFNTLYKLYPKHKAKEQAKKSYYKKFNGYNYNQLDARAYEILKKLDEEIHELSDREEQFIPYLSSWLNQNF